MATTISDGSQPLSMMAVICCSPDAFYSEISKEIVLLNLKTGAYHGLDTVGAAIWRAIGSEATVESVCAAMVREYPGDPSVVRAETVEFIAKLVTRQLITVRAANAGV